MTRDVVRIHQEMPEKLFGRLPKIESGETQRLDPFLIALPHLKMILVFDDEHEMEIDYDYNFDTKMVHAQNDFFSCDYEFETREDGAIKINPINVWCENDDVKKWFYGITKRYISKVTGKEQVTRNFYGICVHYLALQNYICYYGIENIFNVQEKIAKQPSKKHRTGNRKKNNAVRLYKLYTLRKDWDQAKRLKRPVHYSCEAWTSRGHMRHCPSGKIVYVRPCVKGKDREKYIGKEYLLMPKKGGKQSALHSEKGSVPENAPASAGI